MRGEVRGALQDAPQEEAVHDPMHGMLQEDQRVRAPRLYEVPWLGLRFHPRKENRLPLLAIASCCLDVVVVFYFIYCVVLVLGVALIM